MDKETVCNTTSGAKACLSRYELSWMFALIGTGLGAGVLYLPFAIGTGGLIPVAVLTFFAAPLVYLSHRNMAHICLSPALPKADMDSIIRHLFSSRVSALLLFICFLSVFPTVLVYSVGITNIVESFFLHQLHLSSVNTPAVSGLLISLLVAAIVAGEKWLLRIASSMVAPLTLIMLALAVYLIPYWKADLIAYQPTTYEFLKVLLLGLPIMTFSFYHAPMCVVMARGYRERNVQESTSRVQSEKVVFLSTVMLFVVILFFVLSCLLCLTPEEIARGQYANLPILSVLANSSGNVWFNKIAPLIAFLSIATSFFGFFMGAVEIVSGLLTNLFNRFTGKETFSPARVHRISILLTASGAWFAAVSNIAILDLIGVIVAPMMAVVVFLLPILVRYRVPALKSRSSLWQDVYVIAGGVLVILGFVLNQLIAS